LERTDEASVLSGGPLGLDEEAEAVVEGEGGEIGLLLLRGPGGRRPPHLPASTREFKSFRAVKNEGLCAIIQRFEPTRLTLLPLA
jgi:hypothetical protein